MRKRRAKTLLTSDNKRSSSFKAAEEANAAMVDVPATPASKAPNLRLIMGSRQITTSSSLRLNGPKPPERQRRESITESLLDLIQPSSSMPLRGVSSVANVPSYICCQLSRIARPVSMLHRLGIYLVIESHSLRLHHTAPLLRPNRSILVFKRLILASMNRYWARFSMSRWIGSIEKSFSLV